MERNPIETRVEVKSEIKPVPAPVIIQQSLDVSTSTGMERKLFHTIFNHEPNPSPGP